MHNNINPDMNQTSLRRYQALQQQQEKTYKAFDLQQFYENKKLNIQSLKNRIQRFKSSKQNLKQNLTNKIQSDKDNPIHNVYISPNNHKALFLNKHVNNLQYIKIKRQSSKDIRKIELSQQQRNKLKTQSNIRLLQSLRRSQINRQKPIKSNFQADINIISTHNPQINLIKSIKRQKTEQGEQNFQQKSRPNKLFKILPISTSNMNGKGSLKNKESRNNSQMNSRYVKNGNKSLSNNDKSFQISENGTVMDRKICIMNQEQLKRLQILIHQLWNLYQILTKIMMNANSYPFKQSQSIQSYINQVCSINYQQLKIITNYFCNKRLNKVIITSKLLENVSIFYLSLQIAKKNKIKQAHLVNFLGYCTSNIIFIIKILFVLHDLKQNIMTSQFSVKQKKQQNILSKINEHMINLSPKKIFKYSSKTECILESIKKFQMESYKQHLNSLLDIIIRMQHNNETINIIQSRICMQSSKNIQSIITQFLKVIVYDNKPFYEYAHYIFQYLSYEVAKLKIYDILPCIEIAPQPYLNLKHHNTIIIDPYQTIAYQKNTNIYIRAFAEIFIQTISKYSNLIFWSDMMPQQIDPILQIFNRKPNIFRLYKYHCNYANNNYYKSLDRIGGSTDNMLIIDRNSSNFTKHKKNGIQFSWKGDKKDTKLSSLLKILQPTLQNNQPLKQLLVRSRQQIMALTQKRKTNNNTPFTYKNKFQIIDERLQMNRTTKISNQNRNFSKNIDPKNQYLSDNQKLQFPIMTNRRQLISQQNNRINQSKYN